MRVSLLVLSALIAAQEPARTPVAWSLKKGQKVRYEMNHKLTTSNLRGRISEIELTLGVTLEAADPVAGDTTRIRFTFERIAFSNSRGGAADRYDSSRDKEPPAGSYPRVLSKCVGQTLSLGFTPSGTLAAFDELRKMIQAAADAFPDLQKREKWNRHGIDHAARRLEWLLRLVFETPRGGPAAIGDTWETKYEFRELMDNVATATCKARLKEVKDGVATVEQTLEFKYPAVLEALIQEASGRGSYTWDMERGVLKTLGARSTIKLLKGDIIHAVTVSQLPEKPQK
jgi:hypothetical protein